MLISSKVLLRRSGANRSDARSAASRLDQYLLRLSHQRNDTAGLVLGHLSSGRNLMIVGRLASSRWHLEKGLALYDPISHGSLAHQAGDHPG
jgi:hypothetical protein